MNAYEKAQSLGLTGTDAEVVAQLKALGLTASKIPLADLLDVMNVRNMLRRRIRPADSGEKWEGTVVAMMAAVEAGGTDEQKNAMTQWFSHITNDRNSFFDTTLPQYGSAYRTLAMAFGDLPTMPTSADFAAIAAIGGGWIYETTTEAAFAEQRRLAEVDRDYASAMNTHVNVATADPSRTNASVAQALSDAASDMTA